MLPRFSMFPKARCPRLFSPRPCSWPLNGAAGRGLKDWPVAATGRARSCCPQRVGTGIRTPPSSAHQPHDCFTHYPVQLGEKRGGARRPPEALAFLPGRIAIADPDSQRPPRPLDVASAVLLRLLPCYLSYLNPGVHLEWSGDGPDGNGSPAPGCIWE